VTIEVAGKGVTARRVVAGFGLGLLALLTAGCSKSDAGQGNFSSDAETARIEHIVHDYVINHPEILDEAISHRGDLERAKLVNDNRKDIETPFASAWAGARDGDVTLVEFFDYACTFCRANNADITRLLEEDPNLKVVWREFPVLGENSVTAAQASLAAAKQGKFRQFHDALYAAGPPSPESIARVQKAVGVTPIQSVEFTQEIDKNHDLAVRLRSQGTPTFVIGDKIFYGLQSYEAMKAAIAEARKKA
jgi:DSBA-like thioredoxin domain-containing protein/copper resistance ScsC-like protein